MAGMILLTSVASAQGQDQRQYQLAENAYSIRIEGTSNVHDWDMQAEDLQGKAVVSWDQNTLKGFEKVHITVPAKKIESGKRIMNNKTYDALEAENNPFIRFELVSVSNMSTSGSEFSGTATGTLKIAGQSNIVSIPFEGKRADENSFTVTGNFSLQMTEFGIDPPKAMLGTLKTGDKITLNYTLTFNH